MTPTISAVDSSERVLALRLLFARFPVEEQDARLHDTILATERGTLNLDGLLLAKVGDLPVGAALVMPQPDRVALVWPPVVSCGATDETAVENGLMREICRLIDDVGARFGQCLLSPDDAVEAELLKRHGFDHAANLFFLARTLQPEDLSQSVATDPDHAITREIFCDGIAERFAHVIEQSYVGSLDCVYLRDFRTGAEALASHRLSGVFNPSNWWIYTIDGQDAGVLLLSEHPDQDSVEVVYLGVIPELRGLGLGRRMLAEGISHAARMSRAAMFLAVDSENRYANALYGECSFSELARRSVMLRRPNKLARQ